MDKFFSGGVSPSPHKCAIYSRLKNKRNELISVL